MNIPAEQLSLETQRLIKGLEVLEQKLGTQAKIAGPQEDRQSQMDLPHSRP